MAHSIRKIKHKKSDSRKKQWLAPLRVFFFFFCLNTFKVSHLSLNRRHAGDWNLSPWLLCLSNYTSSVPHPTGGIKSNGTQRLASAANSGVSHCRQKGLSKTPTPFYRLCPSPALSLSLIVGSFVFIQVTRVSLTAEYFFSEERLL